MAHTCPTGEHAIAGLGPAPVSGAPGKFGMEAEATLLACPWHGWEYDLGTGQSFMGPGEPRVIPGSGAEFLL